MFEKFVQLISSNKIAAIFLISAIVIIGIAVSLVTPEFQTSNSASHATESSTPSIHTIATQATSTPSTAELRQNISIDVQGAVNNPGVYSLHAESRISDALAAAGELTLQADTTWIARYINRATKLNDGDKLYFPKKGETRELSTSPTQQPVKPAVLGLSTPYPTPSIENTIAPADNKATPNTSNKVSINSASEVELDGLTGIGEKRAKDIINNRPYTKIEELYEKKIIYKSVYEKIKDEISL